MPADGLQWLPKQAVMTAEEIQRIVGIGVERLGVRELRITGGEPLVRPDLVDIIAVLRARHPQLPISMTTNGVGLEERAQALRQAGLTRINVSLDSLHEETFTQLTRRPFLGKVLAGVEGGIPAPPRSAAPNTCVTWNDAGSRIKASARVGLPILLIWVQSQISPASMADVATILGSASLAAGLPDPRLAAPGRPQAEIGMRNVPIAPK